MIFPALTPWTGIARPPGSGSAEAAPALAGGEPRSGPGFAALFMALVGMVPQETAAATGGEAPPSDGEASDPEGAGVVVEGGSATGGETRGARSSGPLADPMPAPSSPRPAATTAGWAVLVETTVGELPVSVGPVPTEAPPQVTERPSGAMRLAGATEAPPQVTERHSGAMRLAGATERPAPEMSASAVSERPTPAASASAASERPTPAASASVVSERPAPAASAPVVSERPTPAASAPVVSERPAPAASASAVSERLPTMDHPGASDEEEAGSAPSAAAPTQVAVAAAAPPVPLPHDVRRADRAPERLAPELREKVARVIERMADEHGTRVELVEGYRTPQRQSYLYAQGRSRPGPVVTWTRNSLHQEGRAADLKVEGPWSGQRTAYVHLQRIAREEGLATLGMKDPGHVELPADAAPSGDLRRGEVLPGPMAGQRTVAPAPTEETPPVPVARVDATAWERVARPAPVAHVASVARPARVAEAGPSRGRKPEVARVESSPEATFPGERVVTARHEAPAPAPVSRVEAPDPVARMVQVERVLEAREALAGLEPQRATIRLDGTAGPAGRVDVELLGHALRSRVTVDDPALATRMRQDVAEMVRVLGEKGIDTRELTVKLAAASADATRDGGWLRPDAAAAQSVRAPTAVPSSADPGRDAWEQGEGGARRDAHDQHPNHQHARRENRRESR